MKRRGFWRQVKKHRLVVTVLVALLASSSTYAYASSVGGMSGGVPAVGEGSGHIDGYSIQNPSYLMNANNPNLITSVTFTLEGASGSTSIRGASVGGSWHTCSSNGGSPPTVTCSLAGETASGVISHNLTVVATGG